MSDKIWGWVHSVVALYFKKIMSNKKLTCEAGVRRTRVKDTGREIEGAVEKSGFVVLYKNRSDSRGEERNGEDGECRQMVAKAAVSIAV